MTAPVSPWVVLGRIEANTPTRNLWTDPHFIYRIKTDENALVSPGIDVAQRAGVLLRRPSEVLPRRAQHVRTAPLTDDLRYHR